MSAIYIHRQIEVQFGLHPFLCKVTILLNIFGKDVFNLQSTYKGVNVQGQQQFGLHSFLHKVTT